MSRANRIANAVFAIVLGLICGVGLAHLLARFA